MRPGGRIRANESQQQKARQKTASGANPDKETLIEAMNPGKGMDHVGYTAWIKTRKFLQGILGRLSQIVFQHKIKMIQGILPLDPLLPSKDS